MSVLRRLGETKEAYEEAESKYGHSKVQYKRRCDGCHRIIDRMNMVNIESATTDGLSPGIHLCRECAAKMVRRYMRSLHLYNDTQNTKREFLHNAIRLENER